MGQLAEDPGPPVLVKLLIQDELPSGGRNVATDLLDQSPPRSCSERNPCPTGDKFSHPPCDLTAGICPDPLKPTVTPPAIGIHRTFGGNQIRFVFDKQLDPAIEVTTIDPMTGLVSSYKLADPSIVALFDAAGHELPSEKYWDSTGSPTVTSDLFLSPLGPAIVLKPHPTFLPLTNYSLGIKPSQIHDTKGQALSNDINGPIPTSYPFTTEGLHQAGGASADLLDPKFDPDGAIDVTDALVIRTSAPFDPATLVVSVKKDGVPVEIAAVPEFGGDPKHCFATAQRPLQINVLRVSGQDRIPWDEGAYTISIQAVALENRAAHFSLDPFGQVPYADVPFLVRQGVDINQSYLADKYLLPWECEAPEPTDLGMRGLGDLVTPPPDMAMTLDGGDMAMSLPDGGDGGADMAAPLDGAADLARPLDGGHDLAKPLDGKVGG